MMTLRLELGPHERFDLALNASRFVLWRQRGAVRVTLDEDLAARVRRSLALHGVGTTPEPGGVPMPPALVRAVGTGLAPARLHGDDLDVVEVTILPLSKATARALWRPLPYWPLGARRRARCRALLRASDALLEIRRTAWCSRATLHAARRSLRPVLFDAGAASPPIRSYATEGRLTRWVEG